MWRWERSWEPRWGEGKVCPLSNPQHLPPILAFCFLVIPVPHSKLCHTYAMAQQTPCIWWMFKTVSDCLVCLENWNQLAIGKRACLLCFSFLANTGHWKIAGMFRFFFGEWVIQESMRVGENVYCPPPCCGRNTQGLSTQNPGELDTSLEIGTLTYLLAPSAFHRQNSIIFGTPGSLYSISSQHTKIPIQATLGWRHVIKATGLHFLTFECLWRTVRR